MRIKNIDTLLNKSLAVSDKLYKKQIITNLQLHACVNCFYFKPFYDSVNLIDKKSKCFKYGSKNIVTNNIEYDLAYNIRKNESKCGINAKNFEDK